MHLQNEPYLTHNKVIELSFAYWRIVLLFLRRRDKRVVKSINHAAHAAPIVHSQNGIKIVYACLQLACRTFARRTPCKKTMQYAATAFYGLTFLLHLIVFIISA